MVLLFDQASSRSLCFRDQTSQTHMRSGEVVIARPKENTSSHLFALFAKRPTLSHQRCQRMAETLVDSFNQTRADFQAQPQPPK